MKQQLSGMTQSFENFQSEVLQQFALVNNSLRTLLELQTSMVHDRDMSTSLPFPSPTYPIAPSTTPRSRIPFMPLESALNEERSLGNEDSVQAVMNNQKITTAMQLGSQLVKVVYTDMELATSTVTGRKVGGRDIQKLDPIKLRYIESLIQQKFPMV